jgi:DNA-binding CsgD family transcriptional regulator
LEPVIDPAVEKPLLKLHRAMDLKSFWRAAHRLLSAAMPNRAVGLSLQQDPGVPVISRWTRAMPDDFFAADPIKTYAAQTPRKKLARLDDLFPNRGAFVRSDLYCRYLEPRKCVHGAVLFFWKRQRLICLIAILRSARQGDFSSAEMELLRQLYPQLLAALRRIQSLERERSVRAGFEEFLRRLPVPTMILRWNLKPIYQNAAAREFCAVWEKGPEEAKRTKATSPVPSEISDRCRILRQRWIDAQSLARSERAIDCKEEQLQHPRFANLRATIQLKQIKSAGMARPHFLIACEDLCRNGAQSRRLGLFRLPALIRLTKREQEVAQLACEGRSNKEIAGDACLSLPMVKKHLHAVFRKLEVPSRTRLVALMQ